MSFSSLWHRFKSHFVSSQYGRLLKIAITCLIGLGLLWLILPPLPVMVNRVLLATPWGQRMVGQDAAATVRAVNQLIELPLEEIPTLATVSDVSKLADQPLFARAQAGDKVLLYPQAQKAYLYRPSTNKLIEVASLEVAP